MKTEIRRRAVVAMADPPAMGEMTGLLLQHGIDVVGQAQSGVQALNLLARTLTDLLIADMVLPALDGLELTRRIKRLSVYTMPVVILTVPAPMPGFEQIALSEGAYAVVSRPIRKEAFVGMLDGLRVEDRIEREGADERHIYEALRKLGFPMRLKGTALIMDGIRLASRDIRLIEELTTRLYPLIARRAGMDVNRVEHAMRRAVESAWSSGALESQHRAFGNTIDARRGKPTSGEMIARMTELLRVKEI